MSVIGEAHDWPGAVRKTVSHRPEIALLDVRMPGMDAADGVGAIHRKCPKVGIVMLSAFDPEEDVYRVIQAGAKGFLLKDCTREQLRQCLHTVSEGKTFLAPGPAAALAARVRGSALTDRQTKIMELVTAGRTNKEIGVMMSIAEGTVKIHMNHIFHKFGVEGRTAAVTKALEHGIVRLLKST